MLSLLLIACQASPPPAPQAPEPAPTPPPAPRAAPPPVAVPPGPSPADLGLPAPTKDTVFAVGDLHADLDNALATLRMVGVIDEAGSWAGGQGTFVQTGDTTDRGPDSRPIMALLRRLEGEAQAAGGKVISLLGNHEVMNLQGDLRYVHPGDVATYGGDAARKASFGPTGDDGRWLRTLDTVAKVGDTVFVHAGVHPEAAALGLEDLNQVIRAGIDAGKGPPLGSDGPLWYRGYVQDPEPQACPLLAEALGNLDAKRMVVGHTTRRNGRVEVRCDGALAVIDIGIADHYGGHLGAWRADAGDARAVYPSGTVDLPDP